MFEGIDGAGKSTQAKLLAKELKKIGRKVVLTKEPTKGEWGREAKWLAQKVTDDHLQQVFAIDRAHHVKELILPALGEGEVVVCDRYALSSIAYSHHAKFAKVANAAFPRPDVTFILDVPVALAWKRLSKRRSRSAFEQKKELERVRRNYLKHKGHAVVIDGTNEKSAVAKKIFSVVKRVLDTSVQKSKKPIRE